MGVRLLRCGVRRAGCVHVACEWVWEVMTVRNRDLVIGMDGDEVPGDGLGTFDPHGPKRGGVR